MKKTLVLAIAFGTLFGCGSEDSTEKKQPNEILSVAKIPLSGDNGDCLPIHKLSDDEWAWSSDVVFRGTVSNVAPIMDRVQLSEDPDSIVSGEMCSIDATFQPGLIVDFDSVTTLRGDDSEIKQLRIGKSVTESWDSKPFLNTNGSLFWQNDEKIDVGAQLLVFATQSAEGLVLHSDNPIIQLNTSPLRWQSTTKNCREIPGSVTTLDETGLNDLIVRNSEGSPPAEYETYLSAKSGTSALSACIGKDFVDGDGSREGECEEIPGQAAGTCR